MTREQLELENARMHRVVLAAAIWRATELALELCRLRMEPTEAVEEEVLRARCDLISAIDVYRKAP